MTAYLLKRPFRRPVLVDIDGDDPLILRAACRRLLGRRRSVRWRYKQIGSYSYRIENRLGLTVAEVWKAPEIAPPWRP